MCSTNCRLQFQPFSSTMTHEGPLFASQQGMRLSLLKPSPHPLQGPALSVESMFSLPAHLSFLLQTKAGFDPYLRQELIPATWAARQTLFTVASSQALSATVGMTYQAFQELMTKFSFQPRFA